MFQTCETLNYDPICVLTAYVFLYLSPDLCRSTTYTTTTSSFVLTIPCLCPIVMDDKGLLHVCIIFIPQGNPKGKISSWGMRAKEI